MKQISDYNQNIPIVYGGRTIYIDVDNKKLGLSPIFKYKKDFKNALAQNVAGGNTMIFNKKAKEIITKCGLVSILNHDWWVYQLITGSGGKFVYDKKPYVLYRQHKENVMGGNKTLKSLFFRGALDT